jgi:hypothetical protein
VALAPKSKRGRTDRAGYRQDPVEMVAFVLKKFREITL